VARIDKIGLKFITSSDELAGGIVSMILPQPRVGYANRILRVFAYMRGGTSSLIRVTMQSSPLTGSPDPIGYGRQIIERARSAPVGFVNVDTRPGILGGNKHQVTVLIGGDVADSILCGMFVDWDFVKV
jgi:hypothetical protein